MTVTKRVSIKSGKPYDVYVGRPSPYGNQWTHIKNRNTKAQFVVATRKEAIQKYKEHLLANPELIEQLEVLRGKTLACWCASNQLCHADVIIELLNKKRLF